jgi:hypothetical protein
VVVLSWRALFLCHMLVFAQSESWAETPTANNLPRVNRHFRFAMVDPPRCEHTFPLESTNQDGRAPLSHWGNVLYVEQNSLGQILLSSCPRHSTGVSSIRPCQNFFQGTIQSLCEGERKAALSREYMIAAVESLLSVNPTTALPMRIVGAARAAGEIARGQ